MGRGTEGKQDKKVLSPQSGSASLSVGAGEKIRTTLAMEVRFVLVTIYALAWACDAQEFLGSCRQANLCCNGRDSSCVVQGRSVDFNSVHHDGHLSDDQHSTRPCYCDHACLKVGDCCPDFQEVCGATDCDVSTWGPWSDCDTECGRGEMTRERRVVRSPNNGGQPCPELIQKRSCYGSRCDEGKAHVKANRETAMILPATYATIRHLNASQDIRSNLRLRYRKDPTQERSKEYCVVFEITKARKTCENLGSDISPKLIKGTRVCVACESAAMRKHLGYRCQGHGADQTTTRFTLLAFPQCHGRWQRLEAKDKCESKEDGKPDFIFV